MPLVKFVYPAILTLVVGALLSAMVLRTGDPTALNPQLPQGSLKSGEEAPEATRDQQETGGGLVIASAAGNSPSSAHRLPSSLPELRSPVGPSSSPELLSPTEPSSSTELLKSDRTIKLDGTAESDRTIELDGIAQSVSAIELDRVVQCSCIIWLTSITQCC